MFSFIQTTLFWINYLSYVDLCKQLYHMKNQVDIFFLAHTQSPEIINFDIIFALSVFVRKYI